MDKIWLKVRRCSSCSRTRRRRKRWREARGIISRRWSETQKERESTKYRERGGEGRTSTYKCTRVSGKSGGKQFHCSVRVICGSALSPSHPTASLDFLQSQSGPSAIGPLLTVHNVKRLQMFPCSLFPSLFSFLSCSLELCSTCTLTQTLYEWRKMPLCPMERFMCVCSPAKDALKTYPPKRS